MGRVRWKGMLAEKARALLLGSVLLLCVLSHGFDSYPPPSLFRWESLSCPPVFGSAVPGFSFFSGPRPSLLVCVPWFRALPFPASLLVFSASCGPALFRVVSLILFSAVSGSFLSSSPPLSKLFFPGKPEVSFFSLQPLGLSLGGVPSLWQAELLASLGGMAPSPRHVLGRRGPVQAGPLPSCRLCLSASSQAPAEAGEPHGPFTLRAELGAESDVC